MITKSPKFEKLVKEKYEQMIEKELSVDILDEKKLGKISVFIGRKPKFIFASFEFDTHKVWVGAESAE